MDEDGTNFGRVVGGIEQVGDNGLDLVIAAVKRFSAAPTAATGRRPSPFSKLSSLAMKYIPSATSWLSTVKTVASAASRFSGEYST
jgi:hypothetical protein